MPEMFNAKLTGLFTPCSAIPLNSVKIFFEGLKVRLTVRHRRGMVRQGAGITLGGMEATTANRTLTLKETIEHVRTFHDAFGIPNAAEPLGNIGERDALLRYKLIREENEEYLDAAMRGDLVEVADALGDILYILCGTLLKHGLEHKIAEVFLEIQRSNMSKLDADGRPIYRDDGKVLKSERYFKPDIAAILTAGS
jgi:predicted HAD superfamily Cof-like phosphohydrolase